MKSIESGTQRFTNLPFTNILKKHVDENGMVDYSALAADIETLDRYLESIAKADIASMRKEDLQATMINLYNAAALKMAATNENELKTLRDVGSAYTRPAAKIAGQDVSLEEIRDGILRVYFDNDPRQLLALSDLGMTAPRPQQFAFEGVDLDKQLREVTRRILSEPITVVNGQTMTLPYVFARFRPSFEKVAKDGYLGNFIRPYLDLENVKIFDQKTPATLKFRPANNALNRR
jgi:hypothetical protein